jgi:hypothetical protein
LANFAFVLNCLLEKLHGDGSPGDDVDGRPDSSHPPFAEQAIEPVATGNQAPLGKVG